MFLGTVLESNMQTKVFCLPQLQTNRFFQNRFRNANQQHPITSWLGGFNSKAPGAFEAKELVYSDFAHN